MGAAREKIVIIESEESSRQRLAELLTGAGYTVSATGSGREGLQAARAGGVDLLLLDANPAGMDCCDVLKELKGSAATQGIRVLLLASGGAEARAYSLDLGADDILRVPGSQRSWRPMGASSPIATSCSRGGTILSWLRWRSRASSL